MRLSLDWSIVCSAFLHYDHGRILVENAKLLTYTLSLFERTCRNGQTCLRVLITCGYKTASKIKAFYSGEKFETKYDEG